jgi:hypothetical protein
MTERSNFPAAYWESDWVKLDQAFLTDFAAFGSRGPFVAATALANAFQSTEAPDVRRVMLTRLLGEYVQAVDNYALLLLAVRTRSHRSVLQTFLDHRTDEVVDLTRDLIEKTIEPKDIATLIRVPEDEWDEDWTALMTVALHLGKMLRAFTEREKSYRRFYAKSKHGFVVVRSPDVLGEIYGTKPSPPWEGDSVVFLMAHGVPESRPSASFVDFGAIPLDQASVDVLLKRCDALADLTRLLAELVAARLARRAF